MVLRTLDELCQRFDVAALYVTHDLSVVATISNRVAVMYAGRLAEIGPVKQIFTDPRHPYTRALLNAIPHLHRPFALTGIPGRTPAPGNRPPGCRFSDRCDFAIEECSTDEPPDVEVSPGHFAACIRTDALPPWDPTDRAVADTDPQRDRKIILAVSDLDIYYGTSHVVHGSTSTWRWRRSSPWSASPAPARPPSRAASAASTTTGTAPSPWTASHWPPRPASGRRAAPPRPVHLPEPVPVAESAAHRRADPRPAPGTVRRRLRTGRPRTGRAAARGRPAGRVGDVAADEPALRRRAAAGGDRPGDRGRAGHLVCDEITSALDVSIQGSITELLNSIKAERHISMLFVTHDLALVRSIADRVLVLQHGRLIESGLAADVLDRPQEEYTQNLLANTPTLDRWMDTEAS
ncbi:MAG: hypothetical protein R2719_13490 [Micropruina sp.]